MLEERERAYKQDLIERLEPRIPSGERTTVVAICQVGLPPWLQVVPLLAGIVLVVVSLFAGALPGWAGVCGALLVLGGIAAMAMVPRRLLARTNRAVHVFELPRSQKVGFEPARSQVAVEELPRLSGGSVQLGGERLWPNYGSGIERDALSKVLAPPD